eukprot:m.220768 g.220768  ORF g.220768 m.220768 type:complete len:961 (-) comp19168_c0_seq3:1568-4450(-)
MASTADTPSCAVVDGEPSVYNLTNLHVLNCLETPIEIWYVPVSDSGGNNDVGAGTPQDDNCIVPSPKHLFCNRAWATLMGDSNPTTYLKRMEKKIFSTNLRRTTRRIQRKLFGGVCSHLKWTLHPRGDKSDLIPVQMSLIVKPIRIHLDDSTEILAALSQVAPVEPVQNSSEPDCIREVPNTKEVRIHRAKPTPQSMSGIHRGRARRQHQSLPDVIDSGHAPVTILTNASDGLRIPPRSGGNTATPSPKVLDDCNRSCYCNTTPPESCTTPRSQILPSNDEPISVPGLTSDDGATMAETAAPCDVDSPVTTRRNVSQLGQPQTLPVVSDHSDDTEEVDDTIQFPEQTPDIHVPATGAAAGTPHGSHEGITDEHIYVAGHEDVFETRATETATADEDTDSLSVFPTTISPEHASAFINTLGTSSFFFSCSSMMSTFVAETGGLIVQNVSALDWFDATASVRTRMLRTTKINGDNGSNDECGHVPLELSPLRSIFLHSSDFNDMKRAAIDGKGNYKATVEVPGSSSSVERVFHVVTAEYSVHQCIGRGVITVTQVDVSQAKADEARLQTLVNDLEKELRYAHKMYTQLQPTMLDSPRLSRKNFSEPVGKLSLAALDKIVKSGFLRKLVLSSCDEDVDVARKARVRANMFLKHGELVLPRTEVEREKQREYRDAKYRHTLEQLRCTFPSDNAGDCGRYRVLGLRSQSDIGSYGASAFSPPLHATSSCDDLDNIGEDIAVWAGGDAPVDRAYSWEVDPEPVNAEVMQRLAAACTGLEIASRWVDRLDELSSDVRAGVGNYPALDLGKSNGTAVFLGGSCGKTTWRQNIAIPKLEEAGVTYYNPQRDDWSPELVTIEAKVKEESRLLLFVIDDTTRALVSVLEAVEHICRGKYCVIVMTDLQGRKDFDGNGLVASDGEMKDLNRLRSYLHDVAVRHGVVIYGDVASAVDVICDAHRRFLQQTHGP